MITDDERRQELIEIWTRATTEVANKMRENFPKFNPGKIFDEEWLIRWENGTLRRAWPDPPEVMALFGRDVEMEFWREARWTACRLEGRARDWYGRGDVCTKATAYVEAIRKMEGR